MSVRLLKNCSDGNLTEIKAILSSPRGRKIKLETRDNHNWTCLHHAVISGSIECVQYLLTVPELDTTAETFEGETALHMACSTHKVPLEIISMLLEANSDLINYVNNEEVDLLQCAIIHKRLDIVKLLVEKGALVNNQDVDGDTSLHIAANECQVDIIRYLLYGTDIDPSICNDIQKTACFVLFAKLIHKSIRNPLLRDEIECFEELAHFTYDRHDLYNPHEDTAEFSFMIKYLYHFNQPRSCLYMKIIKLFHVPPESQYFVQRLLQSIIPSTHSLIVALLKHKDDNIRSSIVWDNFLAELFSLYLLDEPFFNEYIAEIMSRSGWRRLEENQAENLCSYITGNAVEHQKVFNFLKVLILYEIDFDTLMKKCDKYLFPCRKLLNVFAPLVKFVIPSHFFIESEDCLSFIYNFNETENVSRDLQRLMKMDDVHQVVSLKNLCRMSVRKYYFDNYSHYTAINALYTLQIPVQVRNFLCYNFANFKY